MEHTLPVLPPPRTWTIHVSSRFGTPMATCRTCGPLQLPYGQSLRATLLHHLARHAERSVIPRHLRTCQCGQRRCCWHGRPRCCAGPIALALTHDVTAGIWRLADLCHQCRIITPQTAPVPERMPSPDPARPDSSFDLAAAPDAESLLVWETSCSACGAYGCSQCLSG